MSQIEAVLEEKLADEEKQTEETLADEEKLTEGKLANEEKLLEEAVDTAALGRNDQSKAEVGHQPSARLVPRIHTVHFSRLKMLWRPDTSVPIQVKAHAKQEEDRQGP